MPRATVIGWLLGIMIAGLSPSAAWSEEAADPAALGKALGAAKVTLQQGLTASEREGQPISAKFEIDGGRLQLSVYIANSGKFAEVVVDYKTGAIGKTEPITGGDDLTAAKAQRASLAGVKTSLSDATDKAEAESPGYRAISVTPSLKQKHSVAIVELLKGSQIKTAVVPLS